MTHEIKSQAEAFEARWAGLKPWEYRHNDRGYKIGDYLHEREIENDPPAAGEPYYTGRSILSRVMFVRDGGRFGIPPGYCIMTVEMVARGRWLPRAEARD